MASLGNFLVIRALWKSSSIPCNLRKFFISLALSDLAVGLWAELLYGAVIAVMLSETGSGNRKPPEYLCPILITFSYFLGSFLACASFLNITAIAVDRQSCPVSAPTLPRNCNFKTRCQSSGVLMDSKCNLQCCIRFCLQDQQHWNNCYRSLWTSRGGCSIHSDLSSRKVSPSYNRTPASTAVRASSRTSSRKEVGY